MLARVVLAIVLVLVPSTTLASVCCDDTSLIDGAILERAPVELAPIAPERVVVERPLDRPRVSPALARVFRPPR